MNKVITIIFLTVICLLFPDQYYTDINAGLTGVDNSSVAWADFDNDNDLDILISGQNNSGVPVSIIYRNDGNDTFTDINAGLTGVYYYSSVAWGDYDNDGNPDILITGSNAADEPVSIIYRNNGNGTFTDISAGIVQLEASSVAWGDYDNDGDKDILYTGIGNTGYTGGIYRNDNGVFTDINAGLPRMAGGTSDWCDFDNDGDLDIILTGYNWIQERDSQLPFTIIYRNDGNDTFTDINAGLEIAALSSTVLSDYDNDGDMDIIIMGFIDFTGEGVFNLYRNDAFSFTSILRADPFTASGSQSWGDSDNDGDPDMFYSGMFGNLPVSALAINDFNVSGGFISSGFEDFPEVMHSSCAWADYDNDGDLDILITGQDNTGSGISRIYKSDTYKSGLPLYNTNPSPPGNLSAVYNGDSVTLSWYRASDTETPQNGLSYNLYIGTSPGNFDIVSPDSDLGTGYRKLVQHGNVGQNTSWTINDLADGLYYWSVQSIDQSFAGSEFAAEQTFFSGEMSVPQNIAMYLLGPDVNITWDPVPFAAEYKVLASDDPYGTFLDISESGVFTGEDWYGPGSGGMMYYRVIAVSGK